MADGLGKLQTVAILQLGQHMTSNVHLKETKLVSGEAWSGGGRDWEPVMKRVRGGRFQNGPET